MAVSGMVWADLVKEVCHDGGTGPLVLGGAAQGFRAFADAVGVGEDFPYAVLGVDVPGEWETGVGQIDGEGRLVRVPGASSSGGHAVDFSAGEKLVLLTPTADWLAAVEAHGHAIDAIEGLGAALAGKQAASAELAAIAALTSTAFGRGVLTRADAAALRDHAGAVARAGDTMTGALTVPAGTDLTSPGFTMGVVPFYSSASSLAVGANLNIMGSGNTINVFRYQDSGASPVFACRKARGTSSVPTVVVQNDIIGNNQVYGHSGTGFVAGGEFRFTVTAATPSPTDMETDLRMRFCGPGSVSLTEVLRVGVSNGLSVAGNVKPQTDNARSSGEASLRWSVVYAASGTINTSDAREKRDAGAISDALLDAWGAVQWLSFRWVDAWAAKGEDARWHFGLVAQAVRDAIDGALGEGAAVRLGLLCHDSWDEIAEQVHDGETVRAHRPAGDRWGLRYEECFAVEAAWQRREIARLRELIHVAG